MYEPVNANDGEYGARVEGAIVPLSTTVAPPSLQSVGTEETREL